MPFEIVSFTLISRNSLLLAFGALAHEHLFFRGDRNRYRKRCLVELPNGSSRHYGFRNLTFESVFACDLYLSVMPVNKIVQKKSQFHKNKALESRYVYFDHQPGCSFLLRFW